MNPREQYLHQPHEVSLETLAWCNARCTFCPYPTLERKGTKMESALIDRLIREMAEWTEPFFISPFKVNEPLLDNRLKDICEAIESQVKNARLRLFTNGTPLTDRHLNWISDLARLDHLWISLNEVDEASYYQTMGLSYSIVKGNLDRLHARIIAQTFWQNVVVSRVSDGNSFTPSEKDKIFAEFVRKRWPRFRVHIIKKDGWLGYTTPGDSRVPQSPCGRWFELNVMAHGKVALCCMDGTGEFSIGDVTVSSLLDVYNQSHLIERRQHASTRAGITPCERCTY